MSTKCACCRQRYQHAAAYEQHVLAAYHDVMLFCRQITDLVSTTSPVLTSFIEHQALVPWTNSERAGVFLTLSLTWLFFAMIYALNRRELMIWRMIQTQRAFSGDQIHQSRGVSE